MRSILTSLLQLGGMQLVIAATALVRNKVLAARLGTDGFGAYAQLALLAIAGSVLIAFGLGMSLNRNVAAAKNHDERQRLLATANGVTILLALTVVLIAATILAFAPDTLAAVGLTPTPHVLTAAAILLAYLPTQAAAHHRIAFLTGTLDIRGMTAGRSRALALGTLATLPIVWWFGLVGAALQFTFLTFLIVLFLDQRLRTLGYHPWRIHLHRSTLTLLATYGLASLTAGFAQQSADLLVRGSLIHGHGAASNGIYQAALSITYQVKAIVLGSVGALSLATLTQDASPDAMRHTAERLLNVVTPIATLALATLGLLSGPILLLLYTPEFLPAQGILPFLLLGEFLLVPIWVFAAPLLATGRVGPWLGFELGFTLARTTTALLLLPHLGAPGIAIGFAAATVLQLAALTLYVHRAFGLHPTRTPTRLLVSGFPVVALTAWLGSSAVFDPMRLLAGLALLALFTHLAVRQTLGWRDALQHTRTALARKVTA